MNDAVLEYYGDSMINAIKTTADMIVFYRGCLKFTAIEMTLKAFGSYVVSEYRRMILEGKEYSQITHVYRIPTTGSHLRLWSDGEVEIVESPLIYIRGYYIIKNEQGQCFKVRINHGFITHCEDYSHYEEQSEHPSVDMTSIPGKQIRTAWNEYRRQNIADDFINWPITAYTIVSTHTMEFDDCV